MTIELYWDNDEQTVMLCTFGPGWTWDEMFSTLETIKKVTEKREDEIGAIIDVGRGMSIPGGSIFNADTRDKARKMLRMGAQGKGPIVIVGANTMIRAIARGFNMLDRSAMNDVFFADTLNEARSIMTRRLEGKHSESA